MCRGPFAPSNARAIIGVIALYGLLLQAFFVSAMPVIGPDQHVICAPGGDTTRQGGDTPARHDHPCCTVAPLGTLLPPPLPVTVADWAPPRAVAIRWRPEALAPKTGPPTHARSARGPPSA